MTGQPKVLLLPGVDRALALALHQQRATDCQQRGHQPTARHDVGYTCDWCGLILDGPDP